MDERTAEQAPIPRRRRGWWRRIAIALVVCVVLLAAAVAALHLPFARRLVLTRVIDTLEPAGVRLTAARLSYNLVTLRVALEDAELTAVGAGTPFLRFDRAAVDLPWAVMAGAWQADSIEIDRPRLSLVRDAEGRWNLPPGSETTGDPFEGPVTIGRLRVNALDVAYDDGQNRITVDARGLDLDMAAGLVGPLEGTITLAQPATVGVGDRSTTVDTLTGTLAFDGRALALTSLEIGAPEGRAIIDGDVDALGGDPQLDLRYDVRIDAERAARWSTLTPAPTGFVLIDGSATGRRSRPALTASVTSERLAWASLGAITLEGVTSLTDDVLTFESFRVAAAGGDVTTDGRLALAGDAESSVDAEWRGLDLARLLSAIPDLPIRPGSRSTGRLEWTWSGTDVMAGRGRATTTQQATAARPGVLPLAGPIAISGTERRWTLTGSPTVAGAIETRVNASGRIGADPSTSPLDGDLHVEITDLPTAVRTLTDAGLVVDLDDATPTRGSVSAALTLGGTLAVPEATGTVDGFDIVVADTGPVMLTTTLAASPRLVRFEDLRALIGTNRLAGTVDLDLDARRLSGALRADLPDLSRLASALPAEWRPAGSATIEGTLGGALDNPTADLVVRTGAVSVAGQVIDRVGATVRIADRVAAIDALEVIQADGRLTATARYGIDDGRYSFTAAGQGLVVTPIVTSAGGSPVDVDDEGAAGLLPLNARFDLDASGNGTIDAPQAAGTLRFATVDWSRYQLGAVTAVLGVADGSATVAVDVPSMNGRLDASAALESGALTAVVTVDDAAIAGLARSTGPAGSAPGLESEDPDAGTAADRAAITGTVDIRATAEGSFRNLEALDVQVALGLTDASVNGMPVRVARPARIHHVDGAVAAEDLELYLGDTRLTARGRLGADSGTDERLTLDLVGSLTDLTAILGLAPGFDSVAMSGRVALNVEAAGTLRQPDLRAYVTVEDGEVAAGTLPPVTGVSLAASYSAGMVNVSTVAGRWQGADLLAVGHAPLSILGDDLPGALRSLSAVSGPARFDVLIAGLTPEALRPFLAEDAVSQISGRVDLAANVEATAIDLAAVTAEVRLDQAAVELARVPLAQTAPTRLRLANRRLDVVDWQWTGTGNEFSVRGHVLLGEDETTLDLGVAGALDLRMFSAFSPGLATAGRADLDLTATGTATEPIVEGEVALADAAVIVREPRLAITELTGVARLTPNRVELGGLTASANGGEVVIIGSLDYSDFAVADGAISITGRGLALEAVDGLRTELDADLTLSMTPNAPALGGRITIVRGDYREPLRLTEQLFATLEVQTAAGLPTEDATLADDLELDIAIASDQDIAVDNNYGQVEVGVNLRVTGTPAAPVLGGRLALREGGEIFLGGQVYTLQRGTVDFTSATRIEPNFNISLETRVRNHDITLDLTGTPDAMEVSLRGPALSQEDAISLLLTGQTADESTMAYTDVARGQLLMLLSGELLSTAGRAVGLDSVQISRGLGGAASSFDLLATDSDPEARLTLAKNLSREVELIVSQDLRDTGDITWIAIYRPVRRIEIRAATDDDSRETYEFRHEVQFGGGSATAGSSARPPDPRITALRIEGDPGVPNAEILNLLRLEVGNRFDYFTWQRDRDRVSGLYHDRGHFEATIDARREPSGPDGIELVYLIDPGPRTVLEVTGYTLPSAVIEDIEAAWTSSVYDGFLIDDAQQLVRRELIRTHHLQGTSTATMTANEDAGTKTLAVNIEPGTRSESRRIEFTGNRAVSGGDLRDVLEAGRQDVTVWMDPDAIETTLEAYYRARGHLTADVAVGATRFEGSAAVLPVQVDEGPAFRLGMIGVSGAAFRTADAVRTVTGLRSGEPYRPAEIEPARRRVEVDYLGAGYNDVSVSTIVGVDRERGVADVVFAVAEGPQEVLRDVQVRGAAMTSAGTIDRALALDVGDPLDMSGIYAAQKRLYDTSVFQRVDIEVEPIEGATDAAPGTQPVQALVTLEEMPRYRFRYGFRVSDFPGPAEDSHQIRPALVADLLDRNLFGRAIATGVAAQVEKDRRLARALLSLPSFVRLPITTTFYVTRSSESVGEADDGLRPYREDRLDFTFEQRVRPARSMSVTWGYTLGKEHTFDPDLSTDDSPPLDERKNVARLTAAFAWDRRDDPSNATRGWFHSTAAEYGPKALGSHLRYVRMLSQQFYFHRLGEYVVLASAFRIGAGRGYGETPTLSRSERFFTGGGTSIRGFGEEAIGGRDLFGFANGGAALVQFNQEARFPLFRWIHGVTFFDMGNVFPKAGALTFRNLERGAGIGLRIHSPYAILRVDYGVPLSSRDDERPRWYFGIGQTF